MEFLNQVYNEDVMNILRRMPDNCVDMVYSDPDYNVGMKYNKKSYTKKFEEYIDWYIELARESLRVLKDDGNMFFINYPKQNAFLWVNYLDKACYNVYEYVWIYPTPIGHSPRKFTTAHRSILHCTKTKNNKWFKDNVAEPYANPKDKRTARAIAKGSKGRMPYSWLYYNMVKNVSKEKTIHPCQIPIKLAEKLILASTKENDLIFIHFGGSGNEIFVAKNLGRNYVSAEIDPLYYKMIMDRVKLNGEIPPEYKPKVRR